MRLGEPSRVVAGVPSVLVLLGSLLTLQPLCDHRLVVNGDLGLFTLGQGRKFLFGCVSLEPSLDPFQRDVRLFPAVYDVDDRSEFAENPP
jgi:hypothetical protein